MGVLILILVLLLNSFISGNDIIPMSKYEYIPIDFVPYNASKTSIGVNFYEDSYSDYEFIAHNSKIVNSDLITHNSHF